MLGDIVCNKVTMAVNLMPKEDIDETTGLLGFDIADTDSHADSSVQSSRGSFVDSVHSATLYGTISKPNPDEEEQCNPGHVPSTQTYSNGYITRVVVALLVGRSANWANP